MTNSFQAALENDLQAPVSAEASISEDLSRVLDANAHRLRKFRDREGPNVYVGIMAREFGAWAYDENKAPLFRGRWRESGFAAGGAPASLAFPAQTNSGLPKPVGCALDLEIGPGNGLHFAHRSSACPERLLVGIELKYKPLVKSLRLALRAGSDNVRMVRYDADRIGELFAEGELNDVFIYFPDPWPKKRNWKNRLISEAFLETLYRLQAQGSRVAFKTDSEAYFDWAMERAESSKYAIEWSTRDLHRSEFAKGNFVTHFEKLFLAQGLPIYATSWVR